MNDYNKWLSNDCCCGGYNNNCTAHTEVCDCENILLEISNLHTDINVVSGEVNNKLDISTYTPTDLSDYYTKEEIDNKGYLTEHQSLSGYATEQWVENKGYLTEHQHLKTINGQVISGDGNIEIATSGGSVTVDDHIDSASTNPVENKAIYGALNGKLDATAFTPTDLSNYYNKQQVDALIPTVPTNVSSFVNDAHYITSAETANYVTSGNVETQINNHFYCCSEAEWATISGNTQPGVLYLIY